MRELKQEHCQVLVHIKIRFFFTKLKIRKLKDLVHIKNQIHFLSELRGRKLKVLVHIKNQICFFTELRRRGLKDLVH